MQNKKLLYILGGVVLAAVIVGAAYFSSGTLFKGSFGDPGIVKSDLKTLTLPKFDTSKVTIAPGKGLTIDVPVAKKNSYVKIDINNEDDSKTFKSFTLPKTTEDSAIVTQVWDGKDKDGKELGVGKYYIVVQINPTSIGFGGTETIQTGEILKKPLEIATPVSLIIKDSFKVTPSIISPDKDGKDDAANISFGVTEKVAAMLTLLNSADSVVLIIRPKLEVTGSLSTPWIGTDSSGAIVPNGTYTIKLEIFDSANPAKFLETATQTVTVAVPKPATPPTPEEALKAAKETVEELKARIEEAKKDELKATAVVQKARFAKLISDTMVALAEAEAEVVKLEKAPGATPTTPTAAKTLSELQKAKKKIDDKIAVLKTKLEGTYTTPREKRDDERALKQLEGELKDIIAEIAKLTPVPPVPPVPPVVTPVVTPATELFTNFDEKPLTITPPKEEVIVSLNVTNLKSKIEASVKGDDKSKEFQQVTSQAAGQKVEFKWNGTDDKGAPFAPKQYNVSVTITSGEETKKLTRRVMVEAETFDNTPITVQSGKEITIRVPVKLKDSMVKINIKTSDGKTDVKDFVTFTTTKDNQVVEKTWDGKDRDGKDVAGGNYLILIEITGPDKKTETLKKSVMITEVAKTDVEKAAAEKADNVLVEGFDGSPVKLVLDKDKIKLTFKIKYAAELRKDLATKDGKSVVWNDGLTGTSSGYAANWDYTAFWDGKDNGDKNVSPGKYIVKFTIVRNSDKKSQVLTKEIEVVSSSKEQQAQKDKRDTEEAKKKSDEEAKKAAAKAAADAKAAAVADEKKAADAVRAAADKAAADARDAVRAATFQNDQALRELRAEIASLRRAIENAANKVKSGEQPETKIDVATVEISPKIISPNGDKTGDATQVSIRLNANVTALTAKVFDRASKEIKELAVIGRSSSGATIQRSWAGDDESGKIVPDGSYFMRVSAVTANGEAFETTKTVRVTKAAVGQAVPQPAEVVRPAAPEQPGTGATVTLQQPACPAFKDVTQTHPHYDSITYVREKNIVSGYSNCEYRGANPVNRAEYLKMLSGAFNLPIRSGLKSAFKDVDMSQWFYDLVTTFEQNKGVQGDPDGRFRPGSTVNLAEALKMLLDAAGLTSEIAKVQIQPDVCPDVKSKKASAQWYIPYFQVAKNNKLIDAKDNCEPSKIVKRNQAAELLYLYFNSKKK